MRRFLGTALVAVAAPLLTLGVSSGAADASVAPGPTVVARGTTSPCHGYVYKFKKKKATNRIKMTYWVYCDRHVDFLQVRAFIREGDRWAYTPARQCRDTYVCIGHASMRDRPGRQLYTVRAVEGGDLSNVTYVKDGSHNLWSCGGGSTGWGDPMRCGAAGKRW